MRGRRPKPDALKALQGNPGKKRKTKGADAGQESHLDSGVAPAYLDAPSKAVWQELLPMLRERKFVQITDRRTLGRYCKFLALFEAISPLVTAGNVVVTTVSDAVTMDRLNKHFLALLHLDKRLENLEDRFGLNPAARQTLLARAAAQLPRLPLEGQQQQPKPGADVPTPQPAEPRPPSPIGLGRLN